jgi:diacylglycerol kinase (ATP)
VSRIAPWLAARDLAFCILPLGTANNCARSLGQLHGIETIIANLHSAPARKIDLGLVTSSAGHRFFIESTGIGLLPVFINETRALQKENGSKLRTVARKRLADAEKYLLSMAKKISAFESELLLDDETMRGEFLLFEIANIGLVGPGLDLAPTADPRDGFLNVVWVRQEQRKDWLNYLKCLRKGQHTPAPVEERRCQRIAFRHAAVPLHVDGKVFVEMTTPCCVSLQPAALRLMDFGFRTEKGTAPPIS